MHSISAPTTPRTTRFCLVAALVAFTAMFCSMPCALAGTWRLENTAIIGDAAITPDGKYALAHYQESSDDAPMYLGQFDLETGRRIFSFEPADTLVVAPDNSEVFVRAYDNRIYALDLSTGEQREIVKASNDIKPHIAISSDSKELIFMRRIFQTIQWERRSAATGELIDSMSYTYPQYPATVGCTALSPNGNAIGVYHYIMGTVNSGTIDVIDTKTGLVRSITPQNQWGIINMVMSDNGDMCAVARLDRTAGLYSTATGQELMSVAHHESSYELLVFADNDKFLLTGTELNMFAVWDIEKEKFADPLYYSPAQNIKPVRQQGGPLVAMIHTAVGCELPTVRGISYMSVYNAKTRTLQHIVSSPFVADMKGNPASIPVVFSKNGKVAMSSPVSRKSLVFSTQNGELTQTIPTGGAVAFAPGDTSLLIATRGSTLEERHIGTGALLATHTAEGNNVRRIYSSALHSVYALVEDSSITLWDYATGQSKSVFTHGQTITKTRFNSAGTRIMAITLQGTYYSWSTVAGNLLDSIVLPAEYAPYYPEYCDISPDTRVLAVKDINVVHFINLITGKTTGTTEPLHARDYSRMVYCSFSSNGNTLLTTAIADNNPQIEGEEVSTRIRAFSTATGAMRYDKVLDADTYIIALAPDDSHAMAMTCTGDILCLELSPEAVSVDEGGIRSQLYPPSVYPNPAIGETTVRYNVIHAGMQHIDLALYSVHGQKLLTLASGACRAGEYTVALDASALPAAVYYLVLTTSDGRISAPVTVLR